MANGHGGYRRPSNPQPISGPGALSQRTDGGVPKYDVTGLGYGDNAAVNELQSAAPLGAPSGGGQSAPPVQRPPGLGEPTAFPEQPVTAGADAGAGPGSADIGLNQNAEHELRQALGPRLQVFMRMADAPYATPTFKRQVRQLIARIT